jgi:hypothetical protein
MAVIFLIPAFLLTIFNSTPAASAGAASRHQASGRHRTDLGGMKLMSYTQAQKVAQLATFYNTVIAHEQAAYLEALVAAQQAAFYRAVELHQLATALALEQLAAAQAAAAQAAAAAAAATAAAAAHPAPLPAPAASGSDATSINTPDWACIRAHESNDNYGVGGGGAYQFELGTWQGLTGLPSPAQDYPPAVQDAAALKLFSQRGWEPWSTRYVCGL